MNMLYIFLTVIGLMTLLVPAVAILRRGKKDKQNLKESFEKGFLHGQAFAVEEMAKVREERGLGYREAALVVGKKCASCGRKCIHCAREESSQKEFDAAEAEDLYVHHVKEQERADDKVKSGGVRVEEIGTTYDMTPEESALFWGEKKKGRTV